MSVAKKTGNFVVWGILLLLVLGLGGFGVTNFGGSVQDIGSVGDEPISVDDYSRELTQELRAAEAQTKTRIPLAQAEAMGLTDRARGRTITNATLDGELARLGVSVGDAQVRKQVLGVEAFQGPDGKFDRDTYAYTLQQNGLTEAGFEAQVRKETSRTMLQGALLSGVATPVSYGKVLYDFIGARRSYSLIQLTAADLDAPVGPPDDAALSTYYDAHPDDFTAPESKSITYAWLTPDMLINSIDIDEATIKALYDERADEFQKPERRLVERLVYPTMEDAKAAKAKLDSGEATFEQLVKDRGLALSDIDLGDVTRADLGKAGDAVFALSAPGVAGPVMSDLGPALMRMNAILEAHSTSYEDARPDLKHELAQERARRMIADATTDIDDRLAAGATLEDLANETDMQLGTIDYSAQSDSAIAGYDDFRSAADAVKEGDFPEVADLNDGGIFALRLNGVTAAHLRPLDAVRAPAIEGWQKAETARLLGEKATALQALLAAGDAIETLGVPVQTVTGVTRGAISPADLSKAVFDLAKGDSTTLPGENGAVYLVRLDDILPPDAEDTSASLMKTSLEQQAGQAIGQDMFTYFAKSRLNDAGLTLNEAAIRAVHAQLP